MPKLVSVEVKTLGEVFAGERGFRLPWFQRAYSWQTEQVSRLAEDMLEAMAAPGNDDFLLGTLMLAEEAGREGLAIVDGHQRIITLTILAAVLRDLEPPGPTRTLLEGFVALPTGRPARPRLAPQTSVAEFLADYVQKVGATARHVDESEQSFSDSERRIVEAREHLRSRFSAVRGAKTLRRDLTAFLASRCRVIVHLYDSEEFAWRELNVEESTRLAFDVGARAKSTILGVMPRSEREAASLAWEACEDRLGTAAIGELLDHIRLIKRRKRSEKPVEHEICELFDLGRGGLEFVKNWLEPHVEGFVAIRAATKGGGPLGADVVASIGRMNWIERSLWIPPALHWLKQRGAGHADTPAFFRRLDRLVWMMRLGGVDPPLRRIIDVLNELDKPVPPLEMASLAISKELVRDAVENLRAQNFCLKHHAAMVLRRLSAIQGSDPGPVDKQKVTVEHILPRNPDRNRRWWKSFLSQQDVKAHVNRLGNLTFLSHLDNQLAATKDWDEKRDILARSTFILSEQAAVQLDWNREAILKRTETLIALLMRDWELEL